MGLALCLGVFITGRILASKFGRGGAEVGHSHPDFWGIL